MPTIDDLDSMVKLLTGGSSFELAPPSLRREAVAMCLMRRQTAALERVATLLERR